MRATGSEHDPRGGVQSHSLMATDAANHVSTGISAGQNGCAAPGQHLERRVVSAVRPNQRHPGAAALAGALAAVTPTPLPGERYHVRGLTELWAHGLARNSAHTQRSYTHALTLWLDYCLRTGVNPLAARRADMDDWVAQLGSRRAETINARLAGVRSWYRYLISNDVVVDGSEVRDPVTYVERPKRPQGAKTEWLDEAGLNALLAQANRIVEQSSGPRAEIAARNAAVLRVLATTAVRSGAVQLATLADLSEQAGHRVLRYRGKGGAERYKPLVPYATAMLDHYLGLRAEREGVPVAQLTGRVFVTCPYRGRPGGTPLSSGYLRQMIRDLARAADIGNADRLVPHSIRHTVGTLLGRVRPLPEVQDFLDHADPRTTRTYVHTDETLNNSPAYTMVGFIRDDPS